MSDHKLVQAAGRTVTQVAATPYELEVRLQRFVEENMEAPFGVRFLKTEHRTAQRTRTQRFSRLIQQRSEESSE